MNGISVCMIVKDEADCIRTALSSVKDIADEIIIVDTGSTDGTADIARKEFGAKVFNFTWCNDFSAARNESIKHASMPWILVLDADEAISANDRKKILNLVSKATSPIYFLVQTTYYRHSTIVNWIENNLTDPEADGYPGYFESPLARLFRNDERIRFSGVVHEHANLDDGKVQPTMTDIRIHHYGKYVSDERNRKKAEHYLKLGYEKCARQPQDSHAHFELGVQLWEFGRLNDALDYLSRALQLDPKRIDAMIASASIKCQQEKYSEALGFFARVLELEPANTKVYTYLPSVLLDMGDLPFANKIMSTAFSLGVRSPGLMVNKGVYHMRLKEWHHAMKCFREALAINPDEPLALLNMGIALINKGELAEARSFLQKAVKDKTVESTAHRKLGELFLLDQEWSQAAKHFSSAIDCGECDEDVWLKKCIASIRCGAKDEARVSLQNIKSIPSEDALKGKAIEWCREQLNN